MLAASTLCPAHPLGDRPAFATPAWASGWPQIASRRAVVNRIATRDTQVRRNAYAMPTTSEQLSGQVKILPDDGSASPFDAPRPGFSVHAPQSGDGQRQDAVPERARQRAEVQHGARGHAVAEFVLE